MADLYVERDCTAFSRLSQFLLSRSPENVSMEAIHGDFFQKILDIHSRCPAESYAFFFIDPKGWSHIKPALLQDLLRRPRSEFLINFMYDFVNRTVSMMTLQEEMAAAWMTLYVAVFEVRLECPLGTGPGCIKDLSGLKCALIIQAIGIFHGAYRQSGGRLKC
jgi:hypothetical protein